MRARLLTDSLVSDQTGLSVDESLTRCATPSDPVTLRLYTYQPCVLVGRFQHVGNEVNLQSCEALGVPVNRRPTGGGSIIMGPDQLGVALVIPPDSEMNRQNPLQQMTVCAAGIIRALENLGVKAEFQGKNDLVVAGRKIAGLGVFRAPGGAVLFHASLLLDLDLGFMLRVLKTAFDSAEDGGFSAVRERITTLHAEVGTGLGMSDLTQQIRVGYGQQMTVQFETGSLNESEQSLARQLCDSRYASRQWIYQTDSRVVDSVGQYQLRTKGGTLDVRAIVAGRTLKSVFFNGDFMASDNAVHDLESALRWHVCESAALSGTISNSHGRNVQSWHQITVSDITNAVVGAIENAGAGRVARDALTPNACFAREVAVA